MPPSTSPNEGLVRGIGVWTLAASQVNMTVGAGIFVLPAVVAAGMGAAGLLAYAVCAVAIGLIALCHVECGSRVTSSGGPAAYVGAAFGPFAQFVIGTLLWLGWGATSDGAVVAALAATVGSVVPAVQGPLGRTVFLAVVLGGLALVNVRGVRSGARAAAVLTVVKILPIVAFVVVGLGAIHPEYLHGVTTTTSASLGATSMVLFFAFCGTETALMPGAEIERPARTIPLAIALGLATIVTIYGGVQLVAQGVLGDALKTATAAPLADAARQVAGPFGGSVMIAVAGLSMFVLLISDLLATPRAMFRLALDGQLPSALARVHPRHRTPATAIVVYASLAFLFAMSSRFDVLASAASAAILLVYASVAAATIVLRRRGMVSELPPFVTPGGWTVPVLAFVVSGWLLAYTPRPQAIGLAVLTLGIAAIYGVMVLVRTTRAGVAPSDAEGAEP
jgi:APA family basic amino acid/polyamine antiporter